MLTIYPNMNQTFEVFLILTNKIDVIIRGLEW